MAEGNFFSVVFMIEGGVSMAATRLMAHHIGKWETVAQSLKEWF